MHMCGLVQVQERAAIRNSSSYAWFTLPARWLTRLTSLHIPPDEGHGGQLSGFLKAQGFLTLMARNALPAARGIGIQYYKRKEMDKKLQAPL